MAYQTRDSECASILASQKQRFVSELRGSEVWFIFDDEVGCLEIMNAHSNRELVIPTLDLTNALHEIKKIIINQIRK